MLLQGSPQRAHEEAAAARAAVNMSQLVNIYSSRLVMTTATILYVSGGVSFTLLAAHRTLCLTPKGFL